MKTIQVVEAKVWKLEFRVSANPDRRESFKTEFFTLTSETLGGIRKEVRMFCLENGIGGGNWGKNVVTSPDGRLVARMSFNGSVWDASGNEVV